MTPGWLFDQLARIEVELLDEPHILVCTDGVTGTTTYLGPFANAYLAIAGMEECERAQDLCCTMAPLFPAT
ncbi:MULTISPECIES: hypothetical protein [Pimelobacter]|uniref:hypothetical protein n=1 Tax=Pimelobacter TaxID=2044 RepID=UPI001C0549FE|nr:MULTISPECIES: hypothetical protein [Pimelobacter]MBU2693586.1 hypothetical protein [Pimelobacter sp. 30-1]UUW90854.1 hypothetical protein M0M43_05030 [Pimelobacter simplex]UUW94683.1 hypothetical protein M0M48_23535 [Pimelobacter simplex]